LFPVVHGTLSAAADMVTQAVRGIWRISGEDTAHDNSFPAGGATWTDPEDGERQ
jgi:hypothetical protein